MFDHDTDFISLVRNASGTYSGLRMPPLDFVVEILGALGLINVSMLDSAPATNQDTTAWFDPANPSYGGNGALFLWNPSTNAYEAATPSLFAELLAASSRLSIVTLHSNTGIPLNATGVDGDYLVITDGIGGLFGPKASGSWPTVPLIGTTNNIVIAAGAPTAGVGLDADYYFRSDDVGGVYGPKAAGIWPTDPLPGSTENVHTGTGVPANTLGYAGGAYFRDDFPYGTYYKATSTWALLPGTSREPGTITVFHHAGDVLEPTALEWPSPVDGDTAIVIDTTNDELTVYDYQTTTWTAIFTSVIGTDLALIFHHAGDILEPTAGEIASPVDGRVAIVIDKTNDEMAVWDRQAGAWVEIFTSIAADIVHPVFQYDHASDTDEPTAGEHPTLVDGEFAIVADQANDVVGLWQVQGGAWVSMSLVSSASAPYVVSVEESVTGAGVTVQGTELGIDLAFADAPVMDEGKRYRVHGSMQLNNYTIADDTRVLSAEALVDGAWRLIGSVSTLVGAGGSEVVEIDAQMYWDGSSVYELTATGVVVVEWVGNFDGELRIRAPDATAPATATIEQLIAI